MKKPTPIKVNFRDKNNNPTSTTLNFNICQYYCERIGVLHNLNTNLERKTIQDVIQNFVNFLRKENNKINKDMIEKRLLKESTIATVENYKEMNRQYYIRPAQNRG